MPNFIKTVKRRIKVGKETAYGVDPASGYVIVPVNTGAKSKMTGEQIKREVLDAQFGSFGSVMRGKKFENTYQTEAKGGGLENSVLQPPASDFFLQACSLKKQAGFIVTLNNIVGSTAFVSGETIKDNGTNAVVGICLGAIDNNLHLIGTTIPTAADVLIGETSGRQGTVSGTPKEAFFYVPTSNENEMASLTIHDYEDGQRKIATGVRGDLSISLDKGFGKFDFTLQGIFSEPSNQTLPDGAIDKIKPPITDGMGLILGAIDPSKFAVQKLDFKLSNAVAAINDLQQTDGICAINISNGDPTGTLTITKPPLLSDFNPFNWIGNSNTPPTTFPLMVTVGATRSDYVAYSIIIPNAQLTDVDDTSDQDGNALYSLPFSATKIGDNTPTFYLMFF